MDTHKRLLGAAGQQCVYENERTGFRLYAYRVSSLPDTCMQESNEERNERAFTST